MEIYKKINNSQVLLQFLLGSLRQIIIKCPGGANNALPLAHFNQTKHLLFHFAFLKI